VNAPTVVHIAEAGVTGARRSERARGDLALLKPSERGSLRAHLASVASRDFITRWVAYGESRTDAPREFHEAVGSVLVATAIDGQRYLDLAHKRIYPSLYRLNLAGSGKRKTTPHMYGVEALMAAFPERMLASDYSAEALIADLGAKPQARGTAMVDEAGRLLGTMQKNHYGEGLKDLLSKLWDCPEELERKLIRGAVKLRQVYVNLIMATTPSRFQTVVTPEDVASGFLARFLPVIVSGDIVRKPLSVLPQNVAATQRALAEDLKKMYGDMRGEPEALSIGAEAVGRLDAAEQKLGEWARREYHADLIEPWARRLAEYAARLSLIFAVSEQNEDIQLSQVLRALDAVNRAASDVKALVEDLLKGTDARLRDKVAAFITANAGITGRDLQRRTSLAALVIRRVVDELVAEDRVRIEAGPDVRQYRCYPLVAVSTSDVEDVSKDAAAATDRS